MLLPLEPVIPNQCSHWCGNPFSPRRRRGTPVIANHPRYSCHSEPVLTLVWQSVSPVPAPAGAAPPFLRVASGGHLSFNSERKVRKNATKTYGFGFPRRATPCRKFASCFSRNRLSRVPLSVKRTVPPQLSAVASLPLPVATVAAFPSTAVPGHSPSQRTRPR